MIDEGCQCSIVFQIKMLVTFVMNFLAGSFSGFGISYLYAFIAPAIIQQRPPVNIVHLSYCMVTLAKKMDDSSWQCHYYGCETTYSFNPGG